MRINSIDLSAVWGYTSRTLTFPNNGNNAQISAILPRAASLNSGASFVDTFSPVANEGDEISYFGEMATAHASAYIKVEVFDGGAWLTVFHGKQDSVLGVTNIHFKFQVVYPKGIRVTYFQSSGAAVSVYGYGFKRQFTLS